MKKYIAYMLSVLLIASLLVSPIVPSQGSTKVAQAATLAIKAPKTTLEIGTSTTLTVPGTDEDMIEWTSSNEKCVTVDEYGIALAVAIGTATITADIDGKKLTCKIKVVEEPTSLNTSSLTLNVGKKDIISVTGKYSGKVKKATWTTSDKKIATVSNTGVITAVKVGNAVITATFNGKSYTCKVKVNEKISLTKTTLKLSQGQSQQLTFKGISYRAEWSSSNANVAYVSLEGKVIAVAPGKATITGRVDGTNYTCVVTVTKLSTINQKSILVYVGDNKTKLTVPGISSKTTIKWSTNNSKAVTVSSTGTLKVITAGNTTITATVGKKKYTFFLVSVSKSNPYVSKAPVTSVEKIEGKLHLVVPKAWVYDDSLSYDDESLLTLAPDEDGNSGIMISITKTGKPSTDYYTFKNKLFNEHEISEEGLKSSYAYMSGFGVSVTNFKQSNYLSSHGNALKLEYTLTMDDEKSKLSLYVFNMGEYEVNFVVVDGGDAPTLSKTAEYIVNSIYVQ